LVKDDKTNLRELVIMSLENGRLGGYYGEPMTLEELSELAELEEIDEAVYDEGFSDGKRVGFETGFDCGYKEAQEYNVILDGEILDQIYDFKEQILGYRKEPWSENHEHNDMVFEIHKGLMELTETWVMNKVWDYWSKRNEELGD
jgi:hypothetical protein